MDYISQSYIRAMKENNLPYVLRLRWNHCRNSTVCNTTWLGNDSQIQPQLKGPMHCFQTWLLNGQQLQCNKITVHSQPPDRPMASLSLAPKVWHTILWILLDPSCYVTHPFQLSNQDTGHKGNGQLPARSKGFTF